MSVVCGPTKVVVVFMKVSRWRHFLHERCVLLVCGAGSNVVIAMGSNDNFHASRSSSWRIAFSPQTSVHVPLFLL